MQDKVIAITGASSGIGAALARLVGTRGARVALVARREKEVASRAGADAITVVADVTNPNVHVSSVHPGIVATDFGTNALHGGPDSRQFPGAQTAQEVAEVIAPRRSL